MSRGCGTSWCGDPAPDRDDGVFCNRQPHPNDPCHRFSYERGVVLWADLPDFDDCWQAWGIPSTPVDKPVDGAP